MKQKPSSRRKRSSAKSVLRLPDLEHAQAAVLNSLNSSDAKRGYRHAIDEFVDWYCSEPRLAFNRIVFCPLAHLRYAALSALRKAMKSRCSSAGPKRKSERTKTRTCVISKPRFQWAAGTHQSEFLSRLHLSLRLVSD
jgi:hypothetical protein